MSFLRRLASHVQRLGQRSIPFCDTAPTAAISLRQEALDLIFPRGRWHCDHGDGILPLWIERGKPCWSCGARQKRNKPQSKRR